MDPEIPSKETRKCSKSPDVTCIVKRSLFYITLQHHTHMYVMCFHQLMILNVYKTCY